MGIQTLDQKRAADAYKAVEGFMNTHAPRNGNGDRVPKEGSKKPVNQYITNSKKLPMRIIASGLGQTLAFVLAKGECPELLTSLSHWCLTRGEGNPGNPNALLLKIIQGDSEDLRRHTAEALAYLQWLVRFVEAAGIKGEELPS